MEGEEVTTTSPIVSLPKEEESTAPEREGEEVTMFPIASLPEEEESTTLEMEVTTTSPIMSLPEEVRGRIYNFLEQKEAMKYRGVCGQWQKEIHTYYNFQVYLHEGNPHLLDIIERQRITDCTTVQFLLIPPNRTSIFKHANLIQSLTISREASISPDNLQALITECAKSLKRLEIHLTKDLLRFVHPQDHFNFPNLRSLVVVVCILYKFEDLERSSVLQAHVDQEVLLINRLIRDSHKPKLTNLSIKLYLHNQLQVDWYSSTILSTVANHSKTLSRLSLDFQEDGTLPYLEGTFPSNQLEKKDRDRIRKADNLNCLNIRIGSPYGGSGYVLGSLGELSITQKLEKLRIKVTQFEWAFLQEVCWNCFEALVSINVRFNYSTPSKTFDASCLQDCKNLKELSLRRIRLETLELEIDDSYNISNLHLLPESIETLKIEDIWIRTTELLKISSSGLKNLKYLQLMGCGGSPLYGVHEEVFQKVFLLPNLRNFEVGIFNYHDYQEEANLAEFENLKISVESDDPPTHTTDDEEICIPITSDASYDTDSGAIDLGVPPEWKTAMMSQKKLEKLQINVVNLESICHCLEKIGWKWFGSLVSIDVMFRHSTIKTFDASCFKDCGNLKELFLRRIPGEMSNCDNSICNFHLLPESIETLMIENILILTTELEETCTSGFRNLRNLKLEKCGVNGLYGVGWKVFQKLLLLPKLCFIIVKDLNLSDSDEKANFISFTESLAPTYWRHGSYRDWFAMERSSPSCDSWMWWCHVTCNYNRY